MLDPHFRVIRPDSRAHGKTNNPLGKLTYGQMADDVAALCQVLGLTRPLIFGFSGGGQVALEIGMNYPDLAESLVNAGAYYTQEGINNSFLVQAGLEGPGKVNFARFEAENAGWIEMLQEAHVSGGDREYWRTFMLQISSLWWTPLDYSAEDMQKVIAPSLVLLGDRDGIIPIQQAVDMYRMLPNAELAIVPNATHPTTLNPLCAQIVLDFLLRHKEWALRAGVNAAERRRRLLGDI